MSEQRYNKFHTAIQKFASSAPGAWFLARTLHHLDPLIFRSSGGRTTLTSLLSGAPVVLVTTIGARSGLPRTLPLLCIRLEPGARAFALVASNWGQAHHPAWYYNLKAHPEASCTVAGQTRAYLAHEAAGEEYELYWQCAVRTYLGFPQYQRRAGHRHIPILVLTPRDA